MKSQLRDIDEFINEVEQKFFDFAPMGQLVRVEEVDTASKLFARWLKDELTYERTYWQNRIDQLVTNAKESNEV